MMHKNKTNKWMRLAYFLCIPALIGAMCCCAQNTNADNTPAPAAMSDNAVQAKPGSQSISDTPEKKEPVPFNQVEVTPKFNGGDANTFSRWVNQQLEYPETCKKEGISGRVTMSFTISETGQVTDVKVLRGVHNDLDNEAIRVVSSSPDWTPGIADGKAVAIKYTFPVLFQADKAE